MDFVVVGAQKAGSTHLASCLGDHPGLYLCPDEVPYFEDPYFTNSCPAELERAVAPATAGQLRGIHRPEYMPREECAPRIKACSPDARILAVIRDPVNRAISAYYWYVQFGWLPVMPADEGLRQLLDGWRPDGYAHAGEVLEYGRYGEHLRRYVDLFGHERVLVVVTSELHDPATFRRLYGFLDVDPTFVPTRLDEETNPGVFEPRRLRLLRTRRRLVFSWDETDTYVYRPRRLRKPAQFVANAAVVGFDRLVLSRVLGNEAPPVSPEVREALRAYYLPDLPDVEAVLGRDLPGWRV